MKIKSITSIQKKARSKDLVAQKTTGCLENKDPQRPQNLKTKTPQFNLIPRVLSYLSLWSKKERERDVGTGRREPWE